MATGRRRVSVYAKVTDPPWSRYAEEASARPRHRARAAGSSPATAAAGSAAPAQTLWDGEWSIDGRRGRLHPRQPRGGRGAAGRDGGLCLRGADRRGTRRPAGMPLWGRSAGLRQFARAVGGRARAGVTGRANLGSVALMEAAARSAATGRVERSSRSSRSSGSGAVPREGAGLERRRPRAPPGPAEHRRVLPRRHPRRDRRGAAPSCCPTPRSPPPPSPTPSTA